MDNTFQVFKIEVSFVNNISSIDAQKITLFRPRESFYSWQRSMLAKLSSRMEVHKERFTIRDFESFNITSTINSEGGIKGNLDLESIAVIQSSNILPDIARGKKLGFTKFAILPVPNKLFKKCLVSHNEKIIFVPNFKVMYSTMDKLFSTFEDNFVQDRKNSTIIEIQDLEFEDYFKFTIIRNPIDRFLSLYYWSLKRKDLLFEYKEAIETITAKNYSLQSLLEIISKIPDTHSNNHWVSQDYKVKINSVDHYYSMEDSKRIAAELSNQIGNKIIIPHENQSRNNSNRKKELSDNQVKILKARYSNDFNLFHTL